MTNETTLKEDLKAEIEGKRFVRAAALAKLSALPLSEVKDLQEKALWQMAAVFRNAGGARALCEQYGFSKKEAEDLLRRWAEEQQSKGDTKTLEPTYDHATGKYLAFEGWLNQFLKHWDKLAAS
jgi:hypothetical protein